MERLQCGGGCQTVHTHTVENLCGQPGGDTSCEQAVAWQVYVVSAFCLQEKSFFQRKTLSAAIMWQAKDVLKVQVRIQHTMVAV